MKHMFDSPVPRGRDGAASRKARGAFFTPEEIARFITRWAVRDPGDTVMEPSAGDAAFLVEAVQRLRQLRGAADDPPVVHGVEIHGASAEAARSRVEAAGGSPEIAVDDFFLVEPRPVHSVVVGNPPYIRYQDFTGESRARSRAAALRAGVALSALASSWAAFTVHSALFLRPGGRMGLVLPAELLSVNYAAPVRRFLFESFRTVELVLFGEQVFPEAETDVVLLLADGFGEGPAGHARIYEATDAAALEHLGGSQTWTPVDPSAKWTGLLVEPAAAEPLARLREAGRFTVLESWGDTTLGMVTGNNRYFTLSPARVRELGLTRRDLIRLCPPGSTHLRGLELSREMMAALGRRGQATWLFAPSDDPSPAARDYIETGHRAGVDQAYKCRVRTLWYRVPLQRPADLLLTCMNADSPRLTTNSAGVHHLNSVHGVYLTESLRGLGREFLPLAGLNSATRLSAELVGRSYGGGILKLEPREADVWAVPAPELIAGCADRLREIRPTVIRLLEGGDLRAASEIVDDVVLVGTGAVTADDLAAMVEGQAAMARRREVRGRSGR